MDLDPLPPEEPTQVVSDAFGAPPGAPPPPPAPPWESPPDRGRTWLRIGAGVAALALLGGAAFAVGTWGAGSNGNNAAASSTTTAPGGPRHFGFRTVLRGFSGTVSDLKGSTFTVTLARRDGSTRTITVDTSAATKYARIEKVAVTDVGTGDHIVATGTRDAAGHLAAAHIEVLPAGAGGPDARTRPAAPNPPPTAGPATAPFAAGLVTANQNGVITVATPAGASQTITSSPSTTVVKTVAATASDLHDGLVVAVSGPPPAPPAAGQTAPTSIMATRVVIVDAGAEGALVPAGPRGPLGFGRRGHAPSTKPGIPGTQPGSSPATPATPATPGGFPGTGGPLPAV